MNTDVSVGVCAYNEEANIGALLARLTTDRALRDAEIIVVASGCTDRTVEISRQFPVTVITQARREGKASAVNCFLSESSGAILALEGADTIPSQFCYHYLLAPFADRTIGMVGARPIPVNSLREPMGRLSHLLWQAHHEMALMRPKAGEVVAFRRVIEGISPRTLVDEACIEAQVVKRGLRVVYAPDAVVFNRGPGTMADWVRQRTRIHRGHIALLADGYSVSSLSRRRVLLAAWRAARGDVLAFALAAWLEGRCRVKATSADISAAWDMINSTKRLQ